MHFLVDAAADGSAVGERGVLDPDVAPRGADVRTNTFQAGYTDDDPSPTVARIMATWARLNSEFAMAVGSYYWEGDHLHVKTAR